MSLPAQNSRALADFEAAVHEHGRRLFAIAISITRDSHEAEDAVQETMTRAWRKWNTLLDPDRRGAWLARICVNHCLSRRRKVALGLLLGAASLSDRDVQAPPLDVADPDLDRAVAKLTAHQRAVLTLHYQYGFSLDETAELMGSRPGTVRSHLGRALTSLRRDLQNV